MEKRGRPKESHTDPSQQPTKFTRKVTHPSGNYSIWTYDLSKSSNGPISVEIAYPAGFIFQAEVDEKLSKTKRKYLNPKTGREVAYFRYMQIMKEIDNN